MGEEAVLADSGRAGEIAARVGRVRRLAFLSILRFTRKSSRLVIAAKTSMNNVC
jgi:hypothetical protein